MPDIKLLAVIAIVALALAFDYSDGFHDAANSIATIVSTKVLTPRLAVLWAAAFNFIAFFVFDVLFKTTVADTGWQDRRSAVVSEAVVRSSRRDGARLTSISATHGGRTSSAAARHFALVRVRNLARSSPVNG